MVALVGVSAFKPQAQDTVIVTPTYAFSAADMSATAYVIEDRAGIAMIRATVYARRTATAQAPPSS